MFNRIGRTAAGVLAAGAASAALADVTTFDSGLEGWSNSGRETISPVDGNPGANLDEPLIDVFGADIRNEGNPAFTGDFSQSPTRFTVDINIRSIDFFGLQVSRDLVVELRDNGETSQGLPYTSVWYNLGTLSADQPGWRTYAVDVTNPGSATLPAGWGGYGWEDPVTFEPILPGDRTFTDVLANVDEIHFTTFVPGFFFGFTNFDMQVDNVGFTAVPEPTTALLLGLGVLALRRRG